MLTYPWKCTVLHCNHLGNTWKPLVLMTRHFDYCQSASEGDNQSVRSSAPVVSRCFPGGYNVKLYISRGRLAWWLLAFLHSVNWATTFYERYSTVTVSQWKNRNIGKSRWLLTYSKQLYILSEYCVVWCDILSVSKVPTTLPWQWSLITISQENHSFQPMFPTDHCRLVSIFRRKVRWRSSTYNGYLSFDVAFIWSTLTRCDVCYLSV